MLDKPSNFILIVDDESGICKALEEIFKDEGFRTEVAKSSDAALEMLSNYGLDKLPDLVILDIWMPGRDGLETLSLIKATYPTVAVIMISGHATIATAMKATQLGASDFIEKPLDLEATLSTVRRVIRASSAMSTQPSGIHSVVAQEGDFSLLEGGGSHHRIDPIVFTAAGLRGKKIPQKTFKNSAVLYGIGLHTGKKSGLTLEPLPPNSGIHFVGVPGIETVPAFVDFVESTGYATRLRVGQTHISTTEHLMAALHAYGISNLLIKCNGEVPVMDGSALEFCTLIEEIGVEEQKGDWFELVIDKTYKVGRGKEFIQIEPHDSFQIDYTLDYPKPLGEQFFSFVLSSPEDFKAMIAPARTFGFVKDIEFLQKQGLALGGRFDNFILFGPEGPINQGLRFPDEPVRHKILDAVGDLYLLGRKIRGKVTARMTGHSDNIDLLRQIREALDI